MKQHRTAVEIVASMLEVAKGGATKTAIMHQCNFSWPMLNNYLKLVIDRRLIIRPLEPRAGKYTTSRKGLRFLMSYYKTLKLAELLKAETRKLEEMIARP